MSGDQIPNISGSPYSPNRLNAVGKKGGKPAGPKKGGAPSLTPQDKVSLSGKKPGTGEVKGIAAEIKVSPDDMARYLNILADEPDIREDKVADTRRRLDNGEYGADALEKVLDGLEEDLLRPPQDPAL